MRWTPAVVAFILVGTLLPGLRSAIQVVPEVELAADPAAGSLDTTFDDDGVAITELSSSASFVSEAALQPTSAGQRVLVLDFAGRVWRLLADGSIDTSFHGDGIAPVDAPVSPDHLAVLPDGSYVVGTRLDADDPAVPAGAEVGVVRYRADGTLDTGFGADGLAAVVNQPPVEGTSVAFDSCCSSVAAQADGSVVIAGSGVETTCHVDTGSGDLTCSEQPEAIAVARIAPDGAVVGFNSYAPDGVSDVRGLDVAVQPDDRVMVAGDHDDGSSAGGVSRVFVVRFEADMSAVDPAFTVNPVAASTGSLPLAIQPDGSIAVLASTLNGQSWTLVRWAADGSPLGTTVTEFPDDLQSTNASDLVVAADGGLLGAGVAVPGPVPPFHLAAARYTPDGQHAGAGPPHGTVLEVPAPGGASLPEVVWLDGRFMAAWGDVELSQLDGVPISQFWLNGLTADGALDTGFGTDGTGFVAHRVGGLEVGRAVTVLPDGRVVAAGSIQTWSPGPGFVLRHLTDGAPDLDLGPGAFDGVEITRYPAPGQVPITSAGVGDVDIATAPGPPAVQAAVIEVAEPTQEFEVTSPDDVPETDPGFEGTLRWAVQQASGASEPVAVVLNTGGVDIVLTEGQVEYTGDQDLTLVGNGHTITRGTSQPDFRLLDVSNGVTPAFRVQNLTMTEGVSSDGGAIRSTGAVQVESSTFATNEGSDSGGAIFAAGEVEVTGSAFEGNRAGILGGGAIRSPQDVTVTGSSFSGNTSTRGGGAIGSNGNVDVTDSMFDSNEAISDGGGIRTVGNVAIRDSSFSDNAAEDSGGAMWASGDVTVSGSMFNENTAGQEGGAIWAPSDHVAITNSTFTANTAGDTGTSGLRDGGAIWVFGTDLTITGSTFADNVAAGEGAAIWAPSDHVDITNSTFTSNAAGGNEEPGLRDGGAIWVAGIDLTITGSTFADNSAVESGGAIWVASDEVTVDGSTLAGNVAEDEGGAIWASIDNLAITNTTLTANDAGENGGAIWASGRVMLTHVTVASNLGIEQVHLATGILDSFGSVVANPLEGSNCGVTTTQSSYSHDTDGTCGFSGTGDVSAGTSPQLGPLGDNGGPTQTMLPAATSPLVGTIPLDVCADAGLPADQRGQPRPQGPACDKGAVEIVGPVVDIDVRGLAVDDLGRIVIAGITDGIDGVVHRLLPDGGSDPDFRGGFPLEGVELLGTGEFEAAFRDVTLDENGRIVVVGEYENLSEDVSHIVIVRLEANGTADPTFGEAGVVRLTFSEPANADVAGTGVAIDTDGRIVITGWAERATHPNPRDLVLARLLEDGTPDPAFGDGSDGPGLDLLTHEEVVGGTGGELRGTDLVVDTGRTVVVGTATETGQSPMGIAARFLESGDRDPSFGGDVGVGVTATFPDDESSEANAVALDALGNVLVAGGSSHVLLTRLLPTGVRDPSFADGGTAVTAVGGRSTAHDVAVAPDSKIVVTGSSTDDRGTRILVARYNPGVTTLDCQPDPLDFGGVQLGTSNTAGVICTSTGGTTRVTDVVVDPASAHGADFEVDPGTCADATLFPDEMCDLTVTFTAGATGARTASLTVSHTTVTNPTATETVGLQGEGVGEPGFSATPNPLVFPEQIVGTDSAPGTVTVTNVGNLPLTVSDVTIVGARPDDYAITSTTCTAGTIAPGDTCTVGVVFTPQPGAGENRPAQLQFTDSAPGSPHLVALRGSVATTTLELDPDEGPIETEVGATGGGFQPGTPVELSIAGTPVVTVPASEVTTSGFTVTFEIPEGKPGGLQDVLACQACGTPSVVEATAPFEVTPRLFVTPTLSRPGGVVTARGDGFPADTPVTLSWQPGVGRTVVLADSSGEFTVPMLVFRRDILGSRELQARISLTEEVVASTPFLALPGSSQPGDFRTRR